MNPKLSLIACLLCVALAQSLDVRGCDDAVTIGHISEDTELVDCDDDPGNPVCADDDSPYIEIKAEASKFQFCADSDDDNAEDCIIKLVFNF